MAITLDDKKLNEIVERVVEKLAPAVGGHSGPARYQGGSFKAGGSAEPRGEGSRTPAIHASRPGVFDDVDSAVEAARVAQRTLVERHTVEDRERFLAAIRERSTRLTAQLSQMAVEETGLGRYEDKLKKHELAITRTPGMEVLRAEAVTGDHGLTLLERAPYGVIGAITPTTNPSETIICNALGMIAGGNTVVFNTHPAAKRVSRFLVQELNAAIIDAGGPANLLSCMAEPTIEGANKLMKHAGVRLVVVTGGPGVVAAAMQSGKRAVCAGPGNPPVVVDETADLQRAARHIVDGASIDNNIICICEKEIFVVQDVADALKRALEHCGAALMNDSDIGHLERTVLTKDGHVNKEWVGKDAARIADAIGRRVPAQTRILLCEVEEKHPFVQEELLMPVIPITRVRDWEAGVEAAVRAEHGFGHTAMMHSTHIDHLHVMAREVNTSIFVKNGPCYSGIGMGGEGWTSFTIASPTGEGITTARSFTRERRCVIRDSFRII